MENFIIYYYGVYPDQMKKIGENFIIISKEKYYFLYKVNSSHSYKQMYEQFNNLYFVKNNIYDNDVSFYNNFYYVLISIDSNYNKPVDFTEMVDFYNKTTIASSNYKNDWEGKWSLKINSLIMLQNNKSKVDIINSVLLYYYISYAESALKILKYINLNYKPTMYDKVCLTHRRIFYPNFRLYFYNPINLSFDLEVRDIAEYIKVLFYNNKDYISELEYFLKISNLSIYSAYLLFIRIIYPSIFFDYYESGYKMYDVNLFLKTSEYELFIKKTYELINSYVHINKFGLF